MSNEPSNESSNEPARESVIVLGLGAMGTALAGAFLAAGHPTTVWNRTAAKAEPLVARGAVAAASPEAAVTASQLIVACVLDYDTLRSVLAGQEAALAGRTLVNLTSGSPEQAREMAEWAAGLGLAYLDGAIMITPPGIGGPDATVLYSGAPDVLTRHHATLAALGEPVELGPDAGVAGLYDTALLGLMWSALSGWLHGVALVGADGVRAADFTPVANRWLSGAVTGFISRYAAQTDARSYPGDDASLDIHLAAMEHLLHASHARGIDTTLPEVFAGHVRQAIDAGHGADSYARLIEVIEK
ncbi:3-hydroxyisobutyrate dehydrogenase-like beta-hydroxyacid dehydrogenase [Streptomyces sp. 1114.5]|uniref:NAD(P)-dependent oxidoreductase n=1 Tax=Streptomyces sp. 1114.5 TaxID=1938830 RepID=UPI000EAB7500|nr:NAD(P)-binding domain-containing protein [Streptomyces sp. 1114.5]RKT19317.1 3-hydroxyisobutyrate dehydrogenase-like beta-hydroxyacid dehydrogenase [Streptomyces sp. 1114.5]